MLTPGQWDAPHGHCTVTELSILQPVLQHLELEEEDEAFGGFIELHAPRGAMNCDVRGATSTRTQTHSRQTAKIGPTLAGDEDMLHLGQGPAQSKLTGQPLTTLSTVEEVSPVVCVQNQ